MPRLSQKQYARHRKVTPQYISKCVRDGRITVGRDSKIDSVKADAALGARGRRATPSAKRVIKPKLIHVRAESSTASLTAARARKAMADAQISENDLLMQLGRLLPKDEVMQAERQKNANIRTRLRRLPRAVAPLLANIASPAEIERIMLEIVDRELSDMAADPFTPPTLQEPLSMPGPDASIEAAS